MKAEMWHIEIGNSAEVVLHRYAGTQVGAIRQARKLHRAADRSAYWAEKSRPYCVVRRPGCLPIRTYEEAA